jgi:putative flippase GtrA
MIHRQFFFFILNGIVSVALAYFIYKLLISSNILGINWANGIAYISGMIFGFFANRRWTFQDRKIVSRKVITSYLFLYSLTLLVNVFINALTLKFLSNVDGHIFLSFFTAISISTILNFIGMKHFVFNQHSNLSADIKKLREFLQ